MEAVVVLDFLVFRDAFVQIKGILHRHLSTWVRPEDVRAAVDVAGPVAEPVVLRLDEALGEAVDVIPTFVAANEKFMI